MTALAARRIRNAAWTLAAFAAVALGARARAGGLHDPAIATGAVLLALVLLLAAFGAKKRLPFLPLGDGAAWMQLHAWAGLLSAGVFLLHAGIRLPTGALESALAAVFVLVAGSGVVGLLMARALPPVLRARGEPVLWSRIPSLRREVAGRAAALTAPSRALAEYHRLHLAAWFARPADTAAHLVSSRAPLRSRLDRLEALDRYLTAEERATARALVDLVKQKDLLDAHHAIQGALRAWTFLHVPLTLALLFLAAAHALAALAFRGGL